MRRYQRPFRPDNTNANGVMPWRIQRLTDEGAHAVEAGVVVEEPLEIRLDGQSVAVLMRTPGMEKELAAGFCLGEGLIVHPQDIALVRHCGRALPEAEAPASAAPDPLDESRNRVDIILLPGAARPKAPGDVAQLIRSGCGRAEVTTLLDDLQPINGKVQLERETISRFLGQITRQQAAYRAAGGIHAAAVFSTSGRLVTVCEDIGRHNAVDKATGYCLLRGIPLEDKLLISTGRASYDMVAKGVRLGVPIIASISSPTSLAVELAEGLNCTLLGYVRGKALNVYTHGWRIAGQQDVAGQARPHSAGIQAREADLLSSDAGGPARGLPEGDAPDVTTTSEA